MKKLIRIIVVVMVLIMSSDIPASAATKTIATASFKTYNMGYYEEGNKHWYIGEGAVANSQLEEYGCAINQYGLVSCKSYAAVRRYELQTDCDFSFSGTMSLTSGDSSAELQIDFFVCTDKGKIIFPNDGSPFQSVTPKDGAVRVKGESKHMQAGDSIYFVAINKSSVQSKYMQFGASLWETEYGQSPGASFTDTNVFEGIQGEDGWEYLCAKAEDIAFGTAEVEVMSVEGAEETNSNISKYPEDSGIVVSTAKELVEPATLEDAEEPLLEMKTVLTVIIIAGAIILLAQVIVFELIKRKKLINSNKDVK